MANWSYTVGGSRFGDRLMALRWVMLEKGLQKFWNELFTFGQRIIVTGTNVANGNQFALIDFNNTLDVTTAIPKNFADPAGPNANVLRQMPGYAAPQAEEVLFEGFNG